MPRRNPFSDLELTALVSVPNDSEACIRHYTFNDAEREWITSCRGDFNRLGFAVQLAYMKYPGVILEPDTAPDEMVLTYVADQVGVPAVRFSEYASRPQTRREHIGRVQDLLGIRRFDATLDHPIALSALQEKARDGAGGMELAAELVAHFRGRKILLPGVSTIRTLCAEAMTHGDDHLFDSLLLGVTDDQRAMLDRLLQKSNERAITDLTWLRRHKDEPCTRNILALLEKLKFLDDLNIPEEGWGRVSRKRLKRLARVAETRRAQSIQELEPRHRHACLVALALEMRRKLKDKTMDMHIAIMTGELRKAKQRAKSEYLAAEKQIRETLRAYADTGEALDAAKKKKRNGFAAITKIMPWAEFMRHVAQARLLCQSPEVEELRTIKDAYHRIHRYAGQFLSIMPLRHHPCAEQVFEALQAVKRIHAEGGVDPKSLPTEFIKPNWQRVVVPDGKVDVRCYEICAMVALKDAATRGDIWVDGSRHFNDFKEYFITPEAFAILKKEKDLKLDNPTAVADFLQQKLPFYTKELRKVNGLAQKDKLPGVRLSPGFLSISPNESTMPAGARAFNHSIYDMLPKVKITDLLMEVQQWIDFASDFTHAESGAPITADQMRVFLSVILSDGINLGLVKMSDACATVGQLGRSGITYSRLSWISEWFMRDECYKTALTRLLKGQHANPLSYIWGDGTTSASDGLRLETASHAAKGGDFNRRHGPLPGRTMYGSQTDKLALFGPKIITTGHRDATHVLDALLDLEPDWRIKEHYTDTLGYTEHVFGLAPFFGLKFSPRIRNFHDQRLFVPPGTPSLECLDWMVGGVLDLELIKENWDEVLRLATSIRRGTVTASLILRKLGAYPRQNQLARALREIGRLERSIFMLEWLQYPAQRRKTCLGLNKFEGSNALKRAVFVHRGGDLRDRTLEDQQHRAGGLTLVCAAIVLWNTVYLERALAALKERNVSVDPDFLCHLSPQVWDHINLSGDYVWPANIHVDGSFRPLRPWRGPLATAA